MIPRHHVRIEHDGSPYGGVIEVDGRQLHGVTHLNLDIRPNNLPLLTIDVGVYETTTYEGPADVHIPDVTRDTLLALGWGPPEHVAAVLEAERQLGHPDGDQRLLIRRLVKAIDTLRGSLAGVEPDPAAAN